MIQEQNIPNETAEFEKQFSEPVRQAVDTPAPEAGLPPEPEKIVYTVDDKPSVDLTGGEDEEIKPELTKEEKESDEFGKENLVEMGIDVIDGIASEKFAEMSGDGDPESWEADEKERERLKKAAIGYLNTQNVQVSPFWALIIVFLIVYGSRFLLAWRAQKQREKERAEMRRNERTIRQAVADPIVKDIPERTDFKIYANGFYHKNEYKVHQNINEANCKPNFSNAEEVKKLIAANGMRKVTTAFPEMAKMLGADA